MQQHTSNNSALRKRILDAACGRKVILKNSQSPGDIVMMTAAVRDLKLSHRNLLVGVDTPYPALWEHNPYIVPLEKKMDGVQEIYVGYPLIHQSNEGQYHFIHGFRKEIEEKLGLIIRPTAFHGDIHLSEEEKTWMSQVEEMKIKSRFWIIMGGGKFDFTAKWWNPAHYQAVVDHFRNRITFVQCGEKSHWHPPLKGVVNLIGKTNLRQFIRLMYHADGVVCPVTLAMHLAAAVESKHGLKNRPCVVISGGREPAQWEAYPHHRFLSTTACLDCCDNGGCWKSRCQKVGDGDEKDEKDLCVYPVQIKEDLRIAKWMNMIRPEDVIRAIELYYEGGLLKYGSTIGESA